LLLLSVVALAFSFLERDFDRSRLVGVLGLLLLEVLLVLVSLALPGGAFVSLPRPWLAPPVVIDDEGFSFPDKLSASLSALIPQCFS